MENKQWIDFIEENLLEGILAFIFMLPFICIGAITSYMIETQYLKDLVLSASGLIGMFVLYIKVKKSEV